MSGQRVVDSVDAAVEAIGCGWFQLRLVLLMGTVQVGVSMEIMLLGILGPALRCDWHLGQDQVASVTTAFFLGNMVGNPVWGRLADRSGRWPVVLLALLLLAYAGLLSAGAPNFWWIVGLRSLVGFAVSGMIPSSSLMTEFLPRKNRARILTTPLFFWTSGTLIILAVSQAVLPRFGWRWLVGVASMPVALSALCFIWIPSSPRFLLLSGQKKKAQKVLDHIAEVNRRPKVILQTKTEQPSTDTDTGNPCDLLHPHYRLTILLLLFIWFGCGFTYYGAVLTAVELPDHRHHCLQDRRRFSAVETTGDDSSCCLPLTYASLTAQMFGSAGEFLSLGINCFCLDAIGRKATLTTIAILGAIVQIGFNLCAPRAFQEVLFMLGRTATSGIFTVAYVYSGEVFPTSVRSLSLGCCSAAARVGAMLTPYVAQVVLVRISTLVATLIYAGVLLLIAAAGVALPIETRGRSLLQTVASKSDMEPDSTEEQPAGKGGRYETFKEKE